MDYLEKATRNLFFTGKGGVGKTTLACATAIALADRGKRVLLVSTDPASNLDEVLGISLSNSPTPVPGIVGLLALNVNPEAAAREYRERVVGPYRGVLPAAAIVSMEEQLSGSCTVEIAAFDEFSRLLGDHTATADFDHVLFDTAPTGHTLGNELDFEGFGVSTKRVTRRQLLGSVGLTAGAGLLAGCGESVHGSPPQKDTHSTGESENKTPKPGASIGNSWRYVRVDPAVVAAEAYRQFVDGGCMYGLFAALMAVMAKEHGEPYRSFPIHMMIYGEGGVGGWGSLCGTVNGGSAVIGLFEQDKQRRENLIAQLFSWYEKTELPSYQPKAVNESEAIPKTIAGSVLCHASVGNWCKTSGNEIGSQEMKERCRRLTADVAAKTVELLNANLHEPCKFAGLSPEVKSCLSCHGKELHDSLGKMRCNSCHQQLSTKHPALPGNPLKSDKGASETQR